MAKHQNKYEYLYVVQGNYGYGHGWEDLTASESWTESRNDLRTYRREERMGSYRRIERRVLKEEFKNV